ncbi:hypothetical protein Csa_003476, partial [Cucumis sativus]
VHKALLLSQDERQAEPYLFAYDLTDSLLSLVLSSMVVKKITKNIIMIIISWND